MGSGGLEGEEGKGRGFLNMDIIRHNRSKRTKQRLLLFYGLFSIAILVEISYLFPQKW
jgi:hypothetical protein